MLLANETIWCWGYNGAGNLGDGSTVDRSSPVQVSGITNAIAVSCGNYHTCAILSGGTMKCWGRNDFGQLGNGTNTSSSTPVSVSGVTNAAVLGGGFDHDFCAVMSDGTGRCRGNNSQGQIGNGSTGGSSATPVTVTGLTNAIAITSGGYNNACALISGGTIRCWGQNDHGQLGDGTTTQRSSVGANVTGITNATSVISAGGVQSACALLADGTVKCWGANTYGNLGDGTTLERTTPVTALGVANATAFFLGGKHACAVLSSSAVKCWGDNTYGSIGDGSLTQRNTPVAVPGYYDATSASNLP